jgi:hypothetical protein
LLRVGHPTGAWPTMSVSPTPPRRPDDAISAIIAGLHQWEAETDPGARDKIQFELEALVTDSNTADILRALPPELLETPFAMKMLERWSKHDPAAALVWLAGCPKSTDVQIGLPVRCWIERDVKGMSQYIEALPAGDWKQQLLTVAATTALLKSIPEDAVSWLSQLAPERLSPDMLDWAAAIWGQKDVVAAAYWAIEQANPALQDRLLANVVGGYARLNPAGAVDFAGKILQSGEEMNQAAERIATAWVAVDPKAAADWIVQYPDGETRRNTLSLLLYNWTSSDPSAAQNWILEQPAAERDEMLGQLASWKAQDNPAVAINLVAYLSPGPMRDEAGLSVLHQWARGDFEKANAWVNGLSPGSFQSQAIMELGKVLNEPKNIPF